MRKLPEEVSKIVTQLHELRLNNSIFGRSQREESIVNLLKQLEVAKIPGTMPCVARFLVSSSQNLRSVSIETLGKMISNVAPYDLVDLSDHVAWSYEWEVDGKWDRLKPSDVASLAGSPGNPGYSGVLGILSFHRNGYVRHEAVRNLSKISDGSELPFLLIRQNDWVQPVAHDAKQVVDQRIRDEYVQHFARCLRLTLHLESLKRYDHGNAVRKIIELLCLPKHDELLHSVISSSDRKVRQQVTRYVFEIPGEHQLRVLDYGINSSDPLIRQRCCKHLSLIVDSDLFANVVDKLLQDPFMPVRREALKQKSKRFPVQAEQVWRTALFDSSRSIRELSWFMLREFDIDRAKIAAIYRIALAEQPESFSALKGLADVGDLSDASLFRNRLTHPLPTRRAVAVRGIAVQSESAIPEILPHLRDASPCVVREVRKAIGSKAYLVAGNELESIALEAPAFFSRKNAIDLIFAFGKWKSIPWLLSIASSAERATAEYAERKLLRWFEYPECNRVFTRPSVKEKADMISAIAKASGKVSEKTLLLIQSEVAMFDQE